MVAPLNCPGEILTKLDHALSAAPMMEWIGPHDRFFSRPISTTRWTAAARRVSRFERGCRRPFRPASAIGQDSSDRAIAIDRAVAAYERAMRDGSSTSSASSVFAKTSSEMMRSVTWDR